jgi:hypothetical protein
MTPAEYVAVGSLAVNGLGLLYVLTGGLKSDAATLQRLESRVESLQTRTDGHEVKIGAMETKLALLPAMDEKLDGIERRLDRDQATQARQFEVLASRLERFMDNRTGHGPREG